MTWLGKILAVLFLAFMLIAGLWLLNVLFPVPGFGQTVEIPLPSPGALGMISNVGASEIPLEAMRYSLNVDVFTRPGVLKRRVGLTYYGPDHYYFYGAYGYYNPYDRHKLVVGVHDSNYVWFDTLGAAHSSIVGQFFVSDTFATNPDIGVAGLVFPYKDAYHDWLPYKDMLIHCDGKSTPSVITTSQTFHYQDSAFDTSGFEPRAISMGLEAPGQLRVGLTDTWGPLNGVYRYSYAYYNAAGDTTNGTPNSKMARFSAIVSPEYEAPYLTQFEEYGSTSDSVYKLVLRQNMDGREIWYVIDTIMISDFDSTVSVLNLHFNASYYTDGSGRVNAWPNTTFRIVLTNEYAVEDSVIYVSGAGLESVRLIAIKFADSLNAMVSLGDQVIATASGVEVILRTIDTTQDLSYSTDSIEVTQVLDSVDFNNAEVQAVYIDNRPDSSVLAWQRDAIRVDVDVVDTGPYADTIWFDGDTAMVNYAGGSSIPKATIIGILVDLINAHDSAYRFTAYDSATFYVVRSDSLRLRLDSVACASDQSTSPIYNTRWDPSKIDTTMRTPGSLLFDSLTTDTFTIEFRALGDSVYNIAYSYYDPATGFESPLGPTLHTIISDSASSKIASVTTGWPADGRPGWIRLYQGVVEDGLTGFGDTTYWYGLYQMRTRDSARTILWGNWSDDSVVVGLDTANITADTIYRYQQFWTVSGDVVVQPPYHYDLQIPFSQIRYVHFRFYGIGDPLCPNCIYFTPPDTIAWQTSIDDYFLIEPGADEFVALEQISDILYAFKHNSIWYLAGYAAEVETMWGRIIGSDVEVRQLTAAFGAVSRENVVKYNDAIYFLTTKGRVMVLDGQGLREISQPIQDRIDTLFRATLVTATYQMDYKALNKYANLFCADDQLKLINDSSGKLLSYHIPTQTWGEQKYTSFIPTRMFSYDSTQGLVGIGETELYFADGTQSFQLSKPTGNTTDAAGNFEWAAEFSIPGDGMNYYTLRRMDIRHTPLSYWNVRYTLYNLDGDNLGTDYTFKNTADDGVLRWHVVDHVPSFFPFVRFHGLTGEEFNAGSESFPEWTPIPNLFEIESIVFTVEKSGEPETE